MTGDLRELVESVQDNFPETQPLSDLLDEPDSTSESEFEWGHLISSKNFGNLSLKKNDIYCSKMKVETQNFQVYHLAMDNFLAESYRTFSRIHFKIHREDQNVFITDLSKYGTFVNGVKVGKNMSRPLVHNDVITLVSPAFGTVRFVSSTSGVNKEELESLPDVIKSQFIISRSISSGVAGKVYAAFRNEDGVYRQYALKVVRKVDAEDSIDDEVKILRKLKHPNIIRIEESITTKRFFIVVMELAAGGELFKYVSQDYDNNTFDERVAKLQFYQILSGVNYMHKLKVCHRDLKLENILLAQNSREGLIKIADFGLSKVVGKTSLLTSYVGTPSYIAPEVLKNEDVSSKNRTAYNLSVDIWSLGCVLFSLLCGSPAFHARSDEELKAKILRGEFSYNHPGLSRMSHDAKDLVQKLLQVDPKKRLTAKKALKHPWFDDPEVIRKASVLVQSEHCPEGVRGIVLRSESSSDDRKRKNSDEMESKIMPPAKRVHQHAEN